MSVQPCTRVLLGFLVVQCAIAYNAGRVNLGFGTGSRKTFSGKAETYSNSYTGPIAGVIIGVLLAAAILTALIVVICIVHRNKKRFQGRELVQ